MKRFKRLVVLDNLLLPEEVWTFLRACAETMDLYGHDPVHGKAAEPSPPDLAARVTGEASLSQFCEVTAEYSRAQVEELVRRIGDADAVISCWTNLPDEVLSRTPNVRYVAFWTNAYAHRINMRLCEARGIHVDHVADYGTHAVSEYVFGALLTLARALPSQHRDTLRGSWTYEYLKTGRSTTDIDNIPHWDLYGRRIGIVGLGNIGARVALTAALGFGMKVSYYSRTRKRELEGFGIEYEPLDDLVHAKDVISLHLPPDVRRALITRDRMEVMREGTILVNTGSGRALDQDAALDLADAGHLRLVLDVYESHPPRERLKRLAKQPGRHLFTYRGGWYTKDAIILKAEILNEKIAAYLRETSEEGRQWGQNTVRRLSPSSFCRLVQSN